VTFFGLAKKVARLPAGTGEVEVFKTHPVPDKTSTPPGRAPSGSQLFAQSHNKIDKKTRNEYFELHV
jgi:hypothetical protein